MFSLLTLISQVIDLYIWVIFASVIMSWLVAFNVINIRNRYVYMLANALNQMTTPTFAFVRRFLPPIGGLDLAPVVVILGLMFLQNLIRELFAASPY